MGHDPALLALNAKRGDRHGGRSEMPRIVAVADVNRAAAAGLQPQLLSFYRDLLELTPVAESDAGVLAFRGQQVTGPKLLIRLTEKPPEPDVHPLMIQVASLAEISELLAEQGIEVLPSQGMWYYDRRLLAQDPAGNWVSLTASHPL